MWVEDDKQRNILYFFENEKWDRLPNSMIELRLYLGNKCLKMGERGKESKELGTPRSQMILPFSFLLLSRNSYEPAKFPLNTNTVSFSLSESCLFVPLAFRLISGLRCVKIRSY